MQKRIYYHDTDAGGVVYYGNYLKFLEEARTEWLEQKGISITSSHNAGFLYAVRKCNVTYKSPARYGDIIECTAELLKTTAAQMIFRQLIHNTKTQLILVEAEVTIVSLTKDFKPTPIPESVRSLLE